MAFRPADIARIMRRVKRLSDKLESSPSESSVDEWRALRADLQAFVRQNMVQLYSNFVEIEIRRKRGLEDVPTILAAVRERITEQFLSDIDRAVVTVVNQIQAGQPPSGVLAQVRQFFRNLFGAGGYREGGTFTHRGERYWLNVALAIAERKPVVQVAVDQLAWILQYDTPNEDRVRAANITAPLLVVQGSRLTAVDGTHRLAKAVRQGVNQVPARIITEKELEAAKVEVLAVQRSRAGRSIRMRFVPYLQLLFRTHPRNLERDLMDALIRFVDHQDAYLITGGVVENSANTCRFCNNRVLTKEALEYVKTSPELKDRLFHPGCRHAIQPVPPGFRGKVWSLAEVRNRVRNGVLR